MKDKKIGEKTFNQLIPLNLTLRKNNRKNEKKQTMQQHCQIILKDSHKILSH
jgi:hypothetical protein